MRHSFSLIHRIAVNISCALILLIPLYTAAQQATPRKPGRRPVITGPNYRFTAGTSALGIPFQLWSNFVLVQLRLNNSRPLCFLFSSAGTSVIDTRIAKELGLRVQGKEESSATGSSSEAGVISGVSLALPGVTTFDQTVAVLPLEFFSSIMGQPIAGLIGYDFKRSTMAAIGLGSVAERQGKHEEAEGFYLRALSIDQTNADAHWGPRWRVRLRANFEMQRSITDAFCN
jgi:hypothetical protein